MQSKLSRNSSIRVSGRSMEKKNIKSHNEGQRKEGQPQESQSQMQEKKGNMKSNKDIGKWCEFHNIPWQNTDECHSIQSLVAKLKYKESNPNLESNSKNNKRRQIIDAEHIVTIATAKIQPKEDLEEGG
jgi:hypothetical protein